MADRVRVLVVDDNLEMARALGEGLDDHGYQGIAVSSGAEAITRLESGGIGAVVTDLRMPNVDGMEVLRTTQQLAQELRRIVPEGTTEGSLFVPKDYLTLPVLQ